MTMFIKGCIDDLANMNLIEFKHKMQETIDYTAKGLQEFTANGIDGTYEVDPKGFFVEVYI